MGRYELKACPFCGGVAMMCVSTIFTKTSAYVECKQCKARTEAVPINMDYAAGKEAADLWNKRAQDEPKEERVVDILDDVMGNICDEYCKYPDYLSDDALNAKCDECPFERLG